MPKVTQAQHYQWRGVMDAYNHCCGGCASTLDLHYEHVIPKSAGGTDDPSNMQILCHHCNNRKNKTQGIPRVSPRMPEDSCTLIKRNRLEFIAWLDAMRKNTACH